MKLTMKKSVCLLFAGLLTHAAAKDSFADKPDRYKIRASKGTYVLYWDAVYEFNASNSWSTVIEPPSGYTLTDIIVGDTKLFRTERNENRAIIKRIAPDKAATNMTLVLEGPDRIPRTLTFELSGNESDKVSSIRFVLPQDRESNQLVEAAKASYTKQLSEALSVKEAQMKETVHDQTVKSIVPFRFGSYRDNTMEKKYGVRVYLNSVFNSNSKGYVYLSTNASDPLCQVVELISITGKDVSKPVKQISSSEDRGITDYVYETSPFMKDGDKHKYEFVLKVYQDTISIPAKIQ